jgi:hypothetical protein
MRYAAFAADYCQTLPEFFVAADTLIFAGFHTLMTVCWPLASHFSFTTLIAPFAAAAIIDADAAISLLFRCR